MNQREGVVNAIMSVLKSKGIDYQLNGETPVSDHKALFKAETIAIVAAGFMNGSIEMSADAKAKYHTIELLRTKYVPGLVDNWVRKYKPFNGGEKYEIKNPGSRSGSQDAQLIALRNLLKCVADPETKAEIQSAIDARMSEIKPNTTVSINVEALPEHLRHLVG